jgi:hypothetical protein
MSKRCETKVKLSQEFFDYAKEGTKLQYERGGNLKIEDGELHRMEDSTGGFNKIIMPRARADWHSHPGVCRKDACALGIPSPGERFI